MRRALATAAVVGALSVTPLAATPALAQTTVLAQQDTVDVDEPLAEDGNDDTGKYGLIGLTGLLGLFGYKKYREHRATSGTRVGDVDSNASGSRRI